jgi:hypothetical protein
MGTIQIEFSHVLASRIYVASSISVYLYGTGRNFVKSSLVNLASYRIPNRILAISITPPGGWEIEGRYLPFTDNRPRTQAISRNRRRAQFEIQSNLFYISLSDCGELLMQVTKLER